VGGDSVSATVVRTVMPRPGGALVCERTGQTTSTAGALEPGLPVRQLALETADTARVPGASPVVRYRETRRIQRVRFCVYHVKRPSTAK